MSVLFKQGVMGFENLTDETRRGFARLANLFKSQDTHMIVTSVAEGTHSAGSLHYFGRAFDIAQSFLTATPVGKLLGKDWDVINEGTHIHCEYDPKEKP